MRDDIDPARDTASLGFLEETIGQLPRGPSNRFTVTVFDDVVQDPGTTAAGLSNPITHNLLGLFDQLAVEVVVDDWTGTEPVLFQARIYHSGNGRDWMTKSATQEIPSTALIKGKTVLPIGYDDGEVPSLGLVRIRFQVQAASGAVKAHVKARVTGNDFNQIDFTRWIDDFMAKNRDYYDFLEGHTRFQKAWASMFSGGSGDDDFARLVSAAAAASADAASASEAKDRKAAEAVAGQFVPLAPDMPSMEWWDAWAANEERKWKETNPFKGPPREPL